KKSPQVKIILAGMKVPPNMGEEYSEGFEKLFPKLAEKNNLPLIPFLLDKVAGIKELNLPDGIHPNEEGQRIIAQTVMKFILKALEK
ncbi:MAG: arylesterase, partial [Lentisphaeraceae bacterium]|nr:arylesterase [Lentisphaeraceae bacterium]